MPFPNNYINYYPKLPTLCNAAHCNTAFKHLFYWNFLVSLQLTGKSAVASNSNDFQQFPFKCECPAKPEESGIIPDNSIIADHERLIYSENLPNIIYM